MLEKEKKVNKKALLNLFLGFAAGFQFFSGAASCGAATFFNNDKKVFYTLMSIGVFFILTSTLLMAFQIKENAGYSFKLFKNKYTRVSTIDEESYLESNFDSLNNQELF